MSHELPLGWVSVALGDLTTPTRPRRSPQEHPRLPFVGMEQVESRTRRLLGTLPSSEVRSTAFHFQPNDILYGRLRPYLNKVLLPDFEGLCSSEFIVMPPTKAFESRYLAFYLSNDDFVAFANSLNKGDRPRVSFEQIGEHEIPLSPLAEQRRIVAKLEELLGKVDGCRKRLAKIPVLLKRLRQSVLAAACSGRLTADWRQENPEAEAGSELLTRIRASRLASAQTSKDRRQVEEAFETGGPEQDTSLETGDVPESWAVCRVGAIGMVLNGSTPSRQVEEFWGGNIPWVSSGEVRNNVIKRTREVITEEGLNKSSVRLLPKGTVLLAMIGEGKTRGQSAILDIEATINQNIAAIVLAHGYVRADYLWRWFQFQYEATRERGGGSGPQALNCQRVRELPFVLPPLPEQHEIVRRVDALFALADQIEARYAKAKAHVDRLTQSILAKAFRGELVSQDPNDEPASALLERIRAETATKERGIATKRRSRRHPGEVATSFRG